MRWVLALLLILVCSPCWAVDNVWDNSDADNDGNVAANWSQNRVPTTGDVAVFDSATTNDSCTFSGNVSCDGMRFDNTYSGTVDAATHDITLGSDGLDCTGGGSATLDLGSGTWEITDGDWNIGGISATVYSGATVQFKGTCTVSTSNKYINNAEIYGTTTCSGYNRFFLAGNLTVKNGGTLDITSAHSEAVYINTGNVTIESTGTLSGSGGHLVLLGAGTIDNSAGGTWSIGNTTIKRSVTLAAGTYSGDISTSPIFSGQTVTLDTGTITIDGNFSHNATPQDYELDNNSTNLIITGDFSITESGAFATWSAGTGTITFSGSSDQTITTPAGWTDVLEDIVVNKSAGNLILAGDLYAESFTGTSTGTGDFDPGGNTLDFTGNCSWAAAFDFDSAADCLNGSDWQIDGNFTADGQTLNATAGWDLDVTGTAVASGTGDVAYCTAGGTEIDASAGPWTDSGNNANWNFGGGAETSKAMSTFGGP